MKGNREGRIHRAVLSIEKTVYRLGTQSGFEVVNARSFLRQGYHRLLHPSVKTAKSIGCADEAGLANNYFVRGPFLALLEFADIDLGLYRQRYQEDN